MLAGFFIVRNCPTLVLLTVTQLKIFDSTVIPSFIFAGESQVPCLLLFVSISSIARSMFIVVFLPFYAVMIAKSLSKRRT